MTKHKNKLNLIFLLALTLFQVNFVGILAKSSSSNCPDLTSLKSLVASPKSFLGKRIYIEGDFYSFSTLALDYEPAMKSSKDYIGMVLSRPDQKKIPLVELKLAAALKDFKDQNINVEHGDLVRLKAKVYAVALGEPWLEVENIEVLETKKEKTDKG